ncbi:NUDIX hydrolase domain-like protein [Lentinula aff. detonsa]|uniref:NUDIX hydrolase domain-like protein n=1 Tax=Lentinula aff. detonsa TaxID=2804958 RepID=A0AA38KNE9_9AGAR|nr:NUDIX hydrolase domain-like protein [Lentinula aff. detonsa]
MSTKKEHSSNRRNLPIGSRNFLGYHSRSEERVRRSKKLKLSSDDLERNTNLVALTRELKRCLRNLAAYKPPKDTFPQPWLPFPKSRRAAVLVALFVGRKGDLYVLLSKRASTLRSFAGDTSLPGGKMDPEDKSIEDTARREAFEEIGLPPDRNKVPLLCILEPFYVEKQLLVTPVVVLVLDNTLQPILNAPEVTALFSHPLASFLSSTPPASIIRSEPELVELGDDGSGYRYHTSNDWDWDGPPLVLDPPENKLSKNGSANRNGKKRRSFSDSSLRTFKRSDENEVKVSNEPVFRKRKFRMHQFLTGREAGGIKPVFGLTAAILIHTARAGYSPSPPALASPDFEVSAPDGASTSMRIAWAFYRPPTSHRPNLLREALENEGLAGKVNWERVRKVAGVPDENAVSQKGASSAISGSRRLGQTNWIRSKL